MKYPRVGYVSEKFSFEQTVVNNVYVFVPVPLVNICVINVDLC